MPYPMKYMESPLRGMLHIVDVVNGSKFITLCDGTNVETYARYGIGAYPGIPIYCRKCIQRLLGETGKKD